MPVKMTGSQFKAFMDADCWPADAYWEEATVTVDGSEVPEDQAAEEFVSDTSKVVITGGIVYLDNPVMTDSGNSVDAEVFARRWLKAQSVTSVLLEAPKDEVDAILALLKEKFPKAKVAK